MAALKQLINAYGELQEGSLAMQQACYYLRVKPRVFQPPPQLVALVRGDMVLMEAINTVVNFPAFTRTQWQPDKGRKMLEIEGYHLVVVDLLLFTIRATPELRQPIRVDADMEFSADNFPHMVAKKPRLFRSNLNDKEVITRGVSATSGSIWMQVAAEAVQQEKPPVVLWMTNEEYARLNPPDPSKGQKKKGQKKKTGPKQLEDYFGQNITIIIKRLQKEFEDENIKPKDYVNAVLAFQTTTENGQHIPIDLVEFVDKKFLPNYSKTRKYPEDIKNKKVVEPKPDSVGAVVLTLLEGYKHNFDRKHKVYLRARMAPKTIPDRLEDLDVVRRACQQVTLNQGLWVTFMRLGFIATTNRLGQAVSIQTLVAVAKTEPMAVPGTAKHRNVMKQDVVPFLAQTHPDLVDWPNIGLDALPGACKVTWRFVRLEEVKLSNVVNELNQYRRDATKGVDAMVNELNKWLEKLRNSKKVAIQAVKAMYVKPGVSYLSNPDPVVFLKHVKELARLYEKEKKNIAKEKEVAARRARNPVAMAAAAAKRARSRVASERASAYELESGNNDEVHVAQIRTFLQNSLRT